MAAVFKAYRQAYAGLPREIWLLALAIGVNRCGTMVLPFLALFLAEERAFSATEAGKMLAVYGSGAIAGTYLGGWLTQRWGGVRVSILGLALSGPGFIVIPFCGATWQLMAALLYLSVVYETIRPATATATSLFAPPELHPKAYGLNRLAMNLGMSIGPVVGGALITLADSYRYLFWINGAGSVATALLLLVSFRKFLRSSAAIPEPNQQSPDRGPWRDGPFLVFALLQTIGAIAFFQVMSTLPLFWKQQMGINEFWIGVLFVINTVLIVLLEMVLTDRLRLFHPLRLVAVGSAFACFGFGANVWEGGMVYAAVLVVLWTVGEMLWMPFGMTYVASRGTSKSRGAYMGLNSMSFAVAFVVGPVLGMALYDLDPSLPWWCCLALAVLLPIGFWRLAATGRREVGPSDYQEPLPTGRQHAQPRQDDQRMVEPAHAGDVMKELRDKHLPGEPDPRQHRYEEGDARNAARQ